MDTKLLGTFALLLCLLPGSPAAQQHWIDPQGNALEDTSERQSQDGFGAVLILTPDQDWQEQWTTPPDHTPQFSAAKPLGAGDELFILLVLSNPTRDPERGRTDVVCDFTVVNPKGDQAAHAPGVPCFQATHFIQKGALYMTPAFLKVVADPEDPKGQWQVSVVVRDRVKGVALSLRSTFETQ